MEVSFWAGWIGGLFIGMFILLHFWLIGKPLGCSSAYGNVVGFFTKSSFFHTGEYKILNNWKLWFLVGLPLGGFINAMLSPGEWHWSFEMGMYDSILPTSPAAKALWLLMGGFLLGYGARLAGACTTGHALVGCSLVNRPSIFAAVTFFASALIATQLLFAFVA